MHPTHTWFSVKHDIVTFHWYEFVSKPNDGLGLSESILNHSLLIPPFNDLIFELWRCVGIHNNTTKMSRCIRPAGPCSWPIFVVFSLEPIAFVIRPCLLGSITMSDLISLFFLDAVVVVGFIVVFWVLVLLSCVLGCVSSHWSSLWTRGGFSRINWVRGSQFETIWFCLGG